MKYFKPLFNLMLMILISTFFGILCELMALKGSIKIYNIPSHSSAAGNFYGILFAPFMLAILIIVVQFFVSIRFKNGFSYSTFWWFFMTLNFATILGLIG